VKFFLHYRPHVGIGGTGKVQKTVAKKLNNWQQISDREGRQSKSSFPVWVQHSGWEAEGKLQRPTPIKNRSEEPGKKLLSLLAAVKGADRGKKTTRGSETQQETKKTPPKGTSE